MSDKIDLERRALEALMYVDEYSYIRKDSISEDAYKDGWRDGAFWVADTIVQRLKRDELVEKAEYTMAGDGAEADFHYTRMWLIKEVIREVKNIFK